MIHQNISQQNNIEYLMLQQLMANNTDPTRSKLKNRMNQLFIIQTKFHLMLLHSMIMFIKNIQIQLTNNKPNV